jgi:glutamate/tyrosine decarboxylase-like PLP-dependent enzyme
MRDYRALEIAAARARAFLDGLPTRPVGRPVNIQTLRERLGGPLPDEGHDPIAIIEALAAAADPGIVASAGPRYFGFVVGGSLPAALAADWLTSAWDQNAALHVLSPAASVVEEIAGRWLVDLLGLPSQASIGFVTGVTMANFTGLAAARHEVLRRAGWDVEAHGLQGAPPVTVVVGEEAHATLFAALRFLGLGEQRALRVPADREGRMQPRALAATLARLDGPTIVCAQAGNVNSGAFDPFEAIAEAAHHHAAWLHVDGAFGLWAAAAPTLRHLVAGSAQADSWALDAHKWLNVPYDCGITATAHAEAHYAATRKYAPYLVRAPEAARDPSDWTPETSRRAHGFTAYAALRALGRRGVADLVTRSCAQASELAARLMAGPGVEILNEVVLNQVLVRFTPPGGGDADGLTRRVIARIQQDGTCWAGGTVWHGASAMRLSVSGWSTTDDDVARSAEAILAAYRAEAAA